MTLTPRQQRIRDLILDGYRAGQIMELERIPIEAYRREIAAILPSHREREVAVLLLALGGYRMVAVRLGLAEITVKAHVRRLAEKVGNGNGGRPQQVVIAWAARQQGREATERGDVT